MTMMTKTGGTFYMLEAAKDFRKIVADKTMICQIGEIYAVFGENELKMMLEACKTAVGDPEND